MTYPVVKDGVLYLADGSKMKRYKQTIDICPVGADHFMSYYMEGGAFRDYEKKLLSPLWQMLDSVLKSHGL